MRDPVVFTSGLLLGMVVVGLLHLWLCRPRRKPPHPTRLIQHVLDVSRHHGDWHVYCEVHDDRGFGYEVFTLVDEDQKWHFDSDDYEVTSHADLLVLQQAVSDARVKLVS